MTSKLSIDMNIHVYGAYYEFHCHGYQIVYKTSESRNRVRNSTSSKSVNGLARCLSGNKSISPSTSHPIPQIVIIVIEVSGNFSCPEFIPPIMPG